MEWKSFPLFISLNTALKPGALNKKIKKIVKDGGKTDQLEYLNL